MSDPKRKAVRWLRWAAIGSDGPVRIEKARDDVWAGGLPVIRVEIRPVAPKKRSKKR